MIKKGIILAGGSGTRLSPLTKAVNKQLLPIHDKPMIFYPLSVMMLANIRNILIIVNPGQIENFKNLLGDGSRFGVKINYKIQLKPKGLPDAFNLGKKFIGNDSVALILGDNFFYGQSLTQKLEKSSKHKKGATVFLKEVTEPENFGVAKIYKNKIERIVEKPKILSQKMQLQVYIFLIKMFQNMLLNLDPQKEVNLKLQIYSINTKIKKLKFELIGRGAIWSDAGKIEDLSNISNYVRSIEKVQRIKIACLEEIALSKKWITKKNILQNLKFYGNNEYSNYLKKL